MSAPLDRKVALVAVAVDRLDGTRPDCWRYMVEVVEREGATPGDAGCR